MKIIPQIAQLREEVNEARRLDQSIGFVPTMGALHEGHLTLMQNARAENDIVVASIFVNPTQFDNKSDLEKYPRTFERDTELMESVGVDFVFAPTVEEMYPQPIETIVDVPLLSSGLIGKLRPGHFQGMASVVTKLLNIAQADRAYFGEKDYQQLAIIKRMVADLNIPTKIKAVTTVREADGLAMSSRNARLSPEDRAAAPIIFQSIEIAKSNLTKGAIDARDLIDHVAHKISAEPRATVKSIDIVDAATLEPLANIDRPAALLLNVQFGDIILIDQAILIP